MSLPFKRSNSNKKHPLYWIWNSMLVRCYYPSHKQYKDYGGRGIGVDPVFFDFNFFIYWMGTRPSLNHSMDRIDNDRGYEPGNIRWATRRQQQRNRGY